MMLRKRGFQIISKDLSCGGIHGYVTLPKEEVQLRNYLEEQGRENAFGEIAQTYEKVAVLKNMWIEGQEKGKGLGTELLEWFGEKACENDAEAIVLIADTLEENAFNLVEWYQQNGYIVVSENKDQFPVMVKPLDEEE